MDGNAAVTAAVAGLDTGVAHPARVWDFWLGGKDNFAADRAAGQHVLDVYPLIADIAQAGRKFLVTAVGYLAGEVGIRQFLDIGTGLPTANNTHEVAQRVAPETRIAYVDNDPMVLAHARALLRSSPQGSCVYIDADARDTDKILAEAAGTLDFGQPVAVVMAALLHFVPDATEAAGIVRRVMDAVPSGSYLVVSHGTSDTIDADLTATALRGYNQNSVARLTLRSLAEFEGFLDGLEIVPPGIVPLGQWAPGVADLSVSGLSTYTAVARKP